MSIINPCSNRYTACKDIKTLPKIKQTLIWLVAIIASVTIVFGIALFRWLVTKNCQKHRIQNKKISYFSKKHLLHKSSLLTENKLEQDYFNWKAQLLTDLENIKLTQKKSPTYKRAHLTPLKEEEINDPITIKEAPLKITFFAKGAVIYSYNSEGINDYGWGSTWRVLQTILSSYQIKYSLEELFHLFGPLENLQKIYFDKYRKNLVIDKDFIPYTHPNGLANSLVVELALHFLGIKAQLITIKTLLEKKEPSFKEYLLAHFQKPKKTPVLITNGPYTLTIIGVGEEEGNIYLWIADPHIKPGINNQQNKALISPNGLYKVVVNETGEFLSCSLDNNFLMQKNLAHGIFYKELNFNNNCLWVGLFS